MPAYELPNQPGRGRGLLCLADLNAWEREHLPCIKSASGRDLYFSLANLTLLQDNDTTPSLKTLALGLTDRAMRQRIREFEELGLIVTVPHHTDARSRVLKPTQKLLDIFDMHVAMMRRIFRQHFAYTPLSS
jgi:hypothetical protein